MDWQTLVTEVLQDEEGIDPTDGYYSDLRAEATRRGNARSDDLWVANDWSWKKVTTPVTLSGGIGNGYANLPATFQGFGFQMTITIPNTQRPHLSVRPLQEIMAERSVWQGTVAYPTKIAIVDQSNLGVKRIASSRFVANDVVLNITFDLNPPVMVDGPAPSGLEQWPIAYHRSVIKEMLVQEFMRKKGDVRAETSQERKIQEAVKKMIAAEIADKGQNKRLPVHPAARRQNYGFRR